MLIPGLRQEKYKMNLLLSCDRKKECNQKMMETWKENT